MEFCRQQSACLQHKQQESAGPSLLPSTKVCKKGCTPLLLSVCVKTLRSDHPKKCRELHKHNLTKPTTSRELVQEAPTFPRAHLCVRPSEQP